MKKKNIILLFIAIVIILMTTFLYFQVDILKPKHGMGRFGPGVPIRYYDADKKRFVSEKEWLEKYKELPAGYLSKVEWDKRRR